MGTPQKHALLGPSGAKRWLNCTPSARLEEPLPDTSSEAAREGTLAHELGELFAKLLSNRIAKSTFNKKLRVYKKHELFKNEMLEHCEGYANFIMETFMETKKRTPDALLELEQQVDLTDYVPGSFGTVDNTIIADVTLRVTDFKYGKGIRVDAEENEQLMLYALGALAKYDLLYDIETVIMTIYQPRLDNISSCEMSVDELFGWGEMIKPVAQKAFDGEGELVTGDHCVFCKIKNTCRARAEENMDLAKKEFAKPPHLTDIEIEEILPQLSKLTVWAKDIEKYAFQQALEGHKWSGFKLVTGRSNRCVGDEESLIQELKLLKVPQDKMYTKKLVGITEIGKLVGKTMMSDFELTGIIIKPEGKPTLVPESDKRPEIHSKNSAAEDFADTNTLL